MLEAAKRSIKDQREKGYMFIVNTGYYIKII